MGVQRVVLDLSSSSLETATVFYRDVPGLQQVMNHGWIVAVGGTACGTSGQPMTGH